DLLQHELHFRAFLVPEVHPKTRPHPERVGPSPVILRSGVRAVRDALADFAFKIKVFRGIVDELAGGNDMHEYIVANFNKVAKPHRWLWGPGGDLQRPLCGGPWHERQYYNTHECYRCPTLHGFPLQSALLLPVHAVHQRQMRADVWLRGPQLAPMRLGSLKE